MRTLMPERRTLRRKAHLPIERVREKEKGKRGKGRKLMEMRQGKMKE